MQPVVLNSSWADRVDLDNLVPYTHPSAGWSDRHSYLALTWTDPQAMGLQRLAALIGWGGTEVTGRLLAWQLCEGGHALPLALVSRTYQPGEVIETDGGGEIELCARAGWPARNALAVQFAARNMANRPRRLVLSFDHPGKGVSPDWADTYPLGKAGDFFAEGPGHCVSIDGEPAGSWSTLFQHMEHGRNVVWVRNFVAGMPQTTLELVCLSDLADREIELEAGGEATFTIHMAFGLNRGRARAAQRECARVVAADWSPGDETRRQRDVLRRAPALPPKYAGIVTYERMYAHAILGLNSLFIRGEGGYCGERRLPWTTKDLLAIAFFWDTSFSCVGAREFNAAMCQEAIQCFVDNASPRGGLPGTLCDTHRAGEGQAPIMAWATWSIYQRSRDRAWLAQVYPGLAGYCHFWFKYHSSARGLAQFYNAGQIGDNDPRFDPVYNRPQGNEPIYGIESPDLNAFFVVEMRCLAGMAAALSLGDEAAGWRARADHLAQQIVATMYFPEHAMFFDVKEGTREVFSGVKNPNMFLPLWAGVPLPAREVSRIVAGHMLNPDEFFRELPFPSVSYDHPQYDPQGYWRGRIWPHVVYWMIQTLWGCGYHAEAELTAERLLTMFQRTPWFHENYASATGEGWNAKERIGFPDYNWSHATVIELLLERYKEPVVAPVD
jgi:hypothetical protein